MDLGAHVLIVWLLVGSISAAVVPVRVDVYSTKKYCDAAGMVWRGHKETYNHRGYSCLPTNAAVKLSTQ